MSILNSRGPRTDRTRDALRRTLESYHAHGSAQREDLEDDVALELVLMRAVEIVGRNRHGRPLFRMTRHGVCLADIHLPMRSCPKCHCTWGGERGPFDCDHEWHRDDAPDAIAAEE